MPNNTTSLKNAEWTNARTNPAGQPELILPLDSTAGLLQYRHQMVLDFEIDMLPAVLGQLALAGAFGGIVVPVPAIYNVDRTYEWHWKIMRDGATWFEQQVFLTLSLTAFIEAGYGSAMMSLTSWQFKKETIRTLVWEGVPTDANRSVSSSSINGVPYDNATTPQPYFDAFARIIPGREAEVAALQNPAWTHTLKGNVLSEFGITVEDEPGKAGGSVGVGTAIILAAWYSPIYRINLRPGDMVDIIKDTMTTRTLREELYQFRFSGTTQARDIDAFIDMFGGMGMATLDKAGETAIIRYGTVPYGNLEQRDIITKVQAPSLCEDASHQFYLGVLDTQNKRYEERRSRDAGRRFEVIGAGKGIIYKGEVSMPREVTIDKVTGERGAIMWEGNALIFKRSGDNWASAQPITTLKEPMDMALTCTPDGVLRVGNGQGILFEARSKFGPFVNKSVVPLPL